MAFKPPHRDFSKGFGLARFVATVALDPTRLDEFLAAPEREMIAAGLSEPAGRKLMTRDALAVFEHIKLQYDAVLKGIRPAPDEQIGDG